MQNVPRIVLEYIFAILLVLAYATLIATGHGADPAIADLKVWLGLVVGALFVHATGSTIATDTASRVETKVNGKLEQTVNHIIDQHMQAVDDMRRATQQAQDDAVKAVKRIEEGATNKK